jgi:hypothetical protein
MPHHEERPPTTLAHGAAKSDDIERVRRDVDNADECLTQGDEAPVRARRRSRRAERTPEPQPEERPLR